MTFIIINRDRIVSFLFQGVIYTIIILGFTWLIPSYHPDIYTAAILMFFMSLSFVNFGATDGTMGGNSKADQNNILDTYNPRIGKYGWELENENAKQ
jgi:hypothetical protein